MKTKELDLHFVRWLFERIRDPFLAGDVNEALKRSAEPLNPGAELRLQLNSLHPNGGEYDVNFRADGKAWRFDVLLANSDWMMDVDRAEYDDYKDKFFAYFETVVQEASRIFGKPAFNNGFGNPGFPEENAEWASIWNSNDAQLLVLEGQEDSDTPFCVSIVLIGKRAPEPTGA